MDLSSDVCSSALRRDRIWAGRLDVERELDGFITSVKVGGRYSDHHRTNDNARNNDLNTLTAIDGVTPAELIAQANRNCRVPFTTTSYMRGMGTNVTRWATFDNDRSEEHTSELQSLMRISYAVFCLTKKTHTKHKPTIIP